MSRNEPSLKLVFPALRHKRGLKVGVSKRKYVALAVLRFIDSSEPQFTASPSSACTVFLYVILPSVVRLKVGAILLPVFVPLSFYTLSPMVD
jgi:hypothetical protein